MKLMAHTLILLHCIAILLQPVCTSSSLNLREMYQQCSLEDDDITPIDFVFEHLLNFETVINFIEGEEEQEHHPFKTVKPSIQIAVTIPKPVFVQCSGLRYFGSKEKYIARNMIQPVSTVYSDIFHPPRV